MKKTTELQGKVLKILQKKPTTENDIKSRLGLKYNSQVRNIISQISDVYPIWEDDSINGMITYGLLRR